MGILDVANDVSGKKESRLMTAGEAGPRNHLIAALCSSGNVGV
ncbi:hypothetical protein [Acetobacter persici]